MADGTSKRVVSKTEINIDESTKNNNVLVSAIQSDECKKTGSVGGQDVQVSESGKTSERKHRRKVPSTRNLPRTCPSASSSSLQQQTSSGSVSSLSSADCEGAASATDDEAMTFNYNNSDEENDPEIAELAKLRCTSERTEVIAERETRRRRRCADYPGFAFGSSIFSSDTMMKFNIIKNELHNIMNTQLKRVSMP